MAVRQRNPNKTEVLSSPATNRNNRSSNTGAILDSSSFSPFLPTGLETILLAAYPVTLLLGSLFSHFQASTRNATYLPDSQAFDQQHAPSYFAKKSNVFNLYFVKIGWFWSTLAFFLLIFSHSSLGSPLRLQLTRRRIQAIVRYTCITAVWIAVTQWFFGPAIIDRSFRWTGGQCETVMGDSLEDQAKREQMGEVREVMTHAACRAIGGQWTGGHDISGHVFLLILGSAMLWLELLPAVLRMEGLREARRIRKQDGSIMSAAVEIEEPYGASDGQNDSGIGVKAALVVAGLSWWMLLMTAAYFHTWFEKLTGSLVAFSAIYLVYFLPRALPGLRNVLGMPGV